jgi:V/A-type H+-transporting ATPase subunit C
MIYDALTFGYSNARIKSLYGQLLGLRKLERMAKADSMGSAITVLADSSYCTELTELTLLYQGSSLVDHALSLHYSRVCAKILRMTPGQSRPVVEALFSRWDIQDVKTILLSKHLQVSAEDTRPLLMCAGSLTQDETRGLLATDDLPSAVKLLGESTFGRLIQPHMPLYERDGNINPLLAELDRLYLLRLEEAVFETEDRLVRALLMTDLDSKNIMTVLRAKKDGSLDEDGIRHLLVPAGNIGPHELDALIAEKDWVSHLSRIGDFDLSQALHEYGQDQSLTHIEDALSAVVLLHANRTFRASVLSLGVIVGFIYLKDDEQRKIRRIIHAKEYGQPTDITVASLLAGDLT